MASHFIQSIRRITCDGIYSSEIVMALIQLQEGFAMEKTLRESDLAQVIDELYPIASHWHEIGVFLHLPLSKLNIISKQYRSVQEKLREVIIEWMRRGGKEVSWRTLVEVLEACRQLRLAAEIRSKYLLPTSSSSSLTSGNSEGVKPKLSHLVPIPLTKTQCLKLSNHLKISDSVMKRLEKETSGNEHKLKRSMFKTWLERDSEVSWTTLLEALGKISGSLREEVWSMYEEEKKSKMKPSTMQHGRVVDEKDSSSNKSEPPAKPTTMPVNLRHNSPEAHLRSSSSSYHSADETEDISLPSYSSNVDPPIPRSLVKPAGGALSPPPPTSSSFLTRNSRSSNGDMSLSSFGYSDDVPSHRRPASFTSSSPRPGGVVSGGRSFPEEDSVLEFRESVKGWNPKEVDEILKRGRGVDVDMIISEKDRRSALMLSAAADHPPLVRVLLQHKASTTARDKNGMTALFLACSHGNYEIMKLLVEHLADVNAVAIDGTPMMLIPAQKGFSMVTQYLLENGANPNLANPDGITPLMAASKKGQRDVVKVLLSNGADVTLVSIKTSRTALQEAIDNDHKEILPLLIEATKRAKEKNEKLFTCKSAEEARELVRDNAKLDERRGDQATPLIVQVEGGNLEVVKELLKLGANVDLQDDEGETALMKACFRGDYHLVQVIVSYTAILDLKSKGGDTAMIYAVRGGHIAIVRELLLSGADPTIRNKSGSTAQEVAERIGNKVMVEEIKKHTAIADSRDPFISLLSGYLEKVSKNPGSGNGKESSSRAGVILSDRKYGGEGGGGEGGSGGRGRGMKEEEIPDEDGPLREQLNKAWKRVADLETRVHDLTLQTTMEISDDSDLSFYDRMRLEAEFRKLKEMKHKAEQYAIEAKQTAQRLSAENYKLKEDLSREQHFNELERKNILRDMEVKVGHKRGEEEREEALKEVMEQTIHDRAQLLATTMKATSGDGNFLITYDSIKELILNQKVNAKMALFVVTGLPFSGKSTVIRKIFNSSTQTSEQEMYGLAELEAAILNHKIRNISHWSVFQHQQVLLVTIALLKLALQQHPFPKFPSSSPSSTTTNLKVFGEADIDRCFTQMFRNFPNDIMNQEDIRLMLTAGDVSFVTTWDVGMNKAVFDVLIMIAPECENAILLNFFSLNHDTDNIDGIPNLSDPCYQGRYTHSRNDAKQLLRIRTKLEYLLFPMFSFSPQLSCVLVPTHRNLSEREVREKSKRVFNKIEAQFHSQETSHFSLPFMVPVGYEDKKSLIALRKQLETSMSGSDFNIELPMKWGFLRAYLTYTRKLFIPLPQLKTIAKHLHITNGEVSDFIQLFVKNGSIIHVKGHCPECSDEYVIIRVSEFTREVEKLYYIQESSVIESRLKEEAKKGYIPKELADALWNTSTSDPPDRSSFFIHALRRMGIVTALKQHTKDKRFSEEIYFMPRIRPRACNDPPSSDSLFLVLTQGVVFPLPLQSQFLAHFHAVLTSVFQFDPKDCLNTLRFKTTHGENTLTFRFVHTYIEVHGSGFTNDQCSIIKTACIEVMSSIQRQRPKLNIKYSLATLCPNANQRRPHFAEFHPQEISNSVFCYSCLGMVDVGVGVRQWMEAPYTGPPSLVICKEDDVNKSQLFEITESLATLTFDEFANIATDLGFRKPELLQLQRASSIPLKQLKLEILLKFCLRVPCYSVRRRLGQVLLNNQHWKEALKIYPEALMTCLYRNTPPSRSNLKPMEGFTLASDDRPTLRELRIVAMHLPNWEDVGKRLELDQPTLDQCKLAQRTTCEMAYQMLERWRDGEGTKDSKASREHLIDTLEKLKCGSTAAFLKFGETDHYWK